MQTIAALAGQNYAAARPATEPQPGTGAGETALNLARDFTATLQQTEATAQAAMTGEADPHALVQALTQTELAVDAAVAVRDKVVEAYQEILRMPV
ncbi:flagellar hook-basal body complex protein FliE [Lacimonas salitolerans]|uniref:Flagellar hook-basal body complex protein FliE n=1 Tax=Lacimonas salitolerans TaxID=1323750 RepID=A0ABW4EG65_9RHOB